MAQIASVVVHQNAVSDVAHVHHQVVQDVRHVADQVRIGLQERKHIKIKEITKYMDCD